MRSAASLLTPALLVAVVGGAVVGLLGGYALFSAPGGPAVDDRSAEVAELRSEVERLRARLEEDRRRDNARVRVVSDSSQPLGVGADAAPDAASGDPPAATDGVETAPSTPEERQARVDELRAQMPNWFDRGDGKSALAALRELAAIVPEGREAAMQLALDINNDVNGDGKLGLSDVVFYTGLGHPAVVGLLDWALERGDTPSDFRVMAAYGLPWTQSPAETLEQFGRALNGEQNVDVQRALLANLGRMKSPESQRMLSDFFADANKDAAVRGMIAMQLATTDDPGVLRTIETAAASDEDAGVRAAAKAALVLRDPPATGYLVTGTLPSSQAEAAGLRAGDVLVTYDGRPVPDGDSLRAAASEAGGADTVRVVVVRDGREVEVDLRPGRLGVFGRGVEAAEK